MNTSSRFVVAVHILTALDIVQKFKKEGPITSERLAISVNTNPVVIRRILGLLRKAGLVTSQPGAVGGSMLARNAEKITLLDVYRSVEDGQLFHLHYRCPNQDCPVGSNIQDVLKGVFTKAESAMKSELAKVTIAQTAKNILVLSGLNG
jgi:Rrf2 family protein